MRVKALQSFAGKISMYEGETREVTDAVLLQDLLHAGYITELKAEAKPVQKPVENPKTSPKKRVEKKKKK
jgi:hypothetical protein